MSDELTAMAHGYMILVDMVKQLESEKETFIMMTMQRDKETIKLQEQILELKKQLENERIP